MGFYYGQNKPPEDEPNPGSWRETLAIIWVVFKVLAVPLGLLFGFVFALILVFWLFMISGWLGLAAIAAVVAALVARGVWEAKHPPDLG
ncbi:MAG: hypothetical protein KJ048_03145 [Dehalococcoidia bacterium]|nr:hypothetical protein [Dehalococcoidia bacterium]